MTTAMFFQHLSYMLIKLIQKPMLQAHITLYCLLNIDPVLL